jgi:hypothetical protein
MLILLIVLVLIIGLGTFVRFQLNTSPENEQKQLAVREELKPEEWFIRYASEASRYRQDSLKFLFNSVSDSIGIPWTKFRPSDVIGPKLFRRTIFGVEEDWTSFSDYILQMRPDLYDEIEGIWNDKVGGFLIRQLIDLEETMRENDKNPR